MKASHSNSDPLTAKVIEQMQERGLFAIVGYIQENGYDAFAKYDVGVTKYLFGMKNNTMVVIDDIVKTRNLNVFLDVIKYHQLRWSRNDLPVWVSKDRTKIIKD